ncbi:MAG: hypothetical protein IK068_04735, partial [Lachnospiraceae bacterium]|nr:hypothetical protein [Lachnospiraceae bacterium]
LKDKLSKPEGFKNSMAKWTHDKDKSCYICNEFAKTYDRYLDTFFYLYKEDKAFKEKVDNGKGFCLHHFGDLCEYAELHMNEKDKPEFFERMFNLMKTNMERIYEDVSWLIEKFDYRNKDADWKNSKDAVARGMQKLRGSYPGEVHKQK